MRLESITKHFFALVEYSVLFAFLCKYFHQSRVMCAVTDIGVAKGADILLLDAGKVPIQSSVEILPVAFPECYAKAEAEDALDSRLYTVIQ